MGMQMLNIKNILNNLILEKWSPKNKKKHSECKAKVKSRVKKWPSAYASGQVVQCYYGENTKMENLKRLFERQMTETEMKQEKALHKKIPKKPFIDQYGQEKGEEVYYAKTKKMAMEESSCECEKKSMIMEAIKKSAAKKGIKPKLKRKKRGSPWFIHKETGAIIKRRGEGRRYASKEETADVGRIASTLNVKTKPRIRGKAKTPEEIKYALASIMAGEKHGNPVGGAKARRQRQKARMKAAKSRKMTPEQRKQSVRGALSKIAAQRDKNRK
jgi:hypothetical protein